MSPRFVLERENVPYVAEVVNRSLKADCTDQLCQEAPDHHGSVAIFDRYSIHYRSV